MSEILVPEGCVIALIGPSGSGKSAWADAHFAPEQVVSSDELRAMVGTSPADQRAGGDAFDLLDRIVAARIRRRLLTVVDTMGFDDERRAGLVASARDAGMRSVAVVFDTAAQEIEKRNAAARWPLPKRTLAAQRKRFAEVRGGLEDEGWDVVTGPAALRTVPSSMLAAPAAVRRHEEEPMSMKFGLQISSFTWDGGPPALAATLAGIASTAEESGFSSIWVMDHFRQIPQVGPEWHDMLDSYTTLGFLAGATQQVTLGALVTGVGYRNPAHLGKILATLDVLSGGRAVCGLGLGWFEKEARAYGWDFPAVSERYDLLEDTLELLPLLWGPGAKEFQGHVLTVPEAMCYPRPLQERIPILIGGSGEKRTLRLVARHADMCNLFGDPATVRHKLAVLAAHCEEVGRDPAEIEVTHLSQAVVAPDHPSLAAKLEEWCGPGDTPARVAESAGAGTVADQIGRYRELAEAGVQHAIVGIRDVSDLGAVRAFAPLIEAFTV